MKRIYVLRLNVRIYIRGICTSDDWKSTFSQNTTLKNSEATEMDLLKGAKSFSWLFVSEAKQQYDEWYATLAEVCNKEKVGFCIDTNFADFFRPIPPAVPLGNTQQAQLAHRKEVTDFESKVTDYRNKYMIAIGFLKSSLTYGTKVRMEVDMVLARRPPHPLGDDGQPIPGWIWTFGPRLMHFICRHAHMTVKPLVCTSSVFYNPNSTPTDKMNVKQRLSRESVRHRFFNPNSTPKDKMNVKQRLSR